MVPMCVLVGAGLSESHIYCVQVFVYVCPHAVMAWQVLTKMADVLTITFMLYAIQKHKILNVESLPHVHPHAPACLYRDDALFVDVRRLWR